MPIWSPPTPPQDDSDVYIDRCYEYLYNQELIHESQLPPIYVPPKHPKKPNISGISSKPNYDRPTEFSMDVSETEEPTSKRSPSKVQRRDEPIFAPRSLFDRPTPAMAKMRRDYRLQKYSCRSTAPTVKNTLGPGSISFPIIPPASAKPPPPPPPDMPEWSVTEDNALLTTIQHILELPLHLLVVNLAQTPNWDLAAEIVNLTSKSYRTAKHCRWRYENIVGPREEGKLCFDLPSLSPTSPAAKKKKAKAFIKITPPSPSKAARYLKMAQLMAQDNNTTYTNLFTQKFDAIKSISTKRAPTSKPMTINPSMKSNKQAAIFTEHGINYENPLPATSIAQSRIERIQLERKKLLQQQQMQQQASASLPVNGGTSPSASSQSPSISMALAGSVTPTSPVAVSSPPPIAAPTTPTVVSIPSQSVAPTTPTVVSTPSSSSSAPLGTVVNQGAPRHVQLLKQQTIGGKTITRTVTDAEVAALLKQHGLTQQRLAVATQGGGQTQLQSSPKTQMTSFPMSTATHTLLTSVGLQNIMKVQQPATGQQIATLVKSPMPQTSQQSLPIQLSQVKTVNAVSATTPKPQPQAPQLTAIQQQLLLQCHKQQQQQLQVSAGNKVTQIGQLISVGPNPGMQPLTQTIQVMTAPRTTILGSGTTLARPPITGVVQQPTYSPLKTVGTPPTTAALPLPTIFPQGQFAAATNNIIKVQQPATAQQIATLVKSPVPQTSQQSGTVNLPLQLSQVKTINKVAATVPKPQAPAQPLTPIQQQLLLQRHKQQQQLQVSAGNKVTQIGQLISVNTNTGLQPLTQTIQVMTAPRTTILGTGTTLARPPVTGVTQQSTYAPLKAVSTPTTTTFSLPAIFPQGQFAAATSNIIKVQQPATAQQITTLVKSPLPQTSQQSGTVNLPIQLSQVKTVNTVAATVSKSQPQVQQLTPIQQQLLLQRHKQQQQQQLQVSAGNKVTQIGQLISVNTNAGLQPLTQTIQVMTTPRTTILGPGTTLARPSLTGVTQQPTYSSLKMINTPMPVTMPLATTTSFALPSLFPPGQMAHTPIQGQPLSIRLQNTRTTTVASEPPTAPGALTAVTVATPGTSTATPQLVVSDEAATPITSVTTPPTSQP